MHYCYKHCLRLFCCLQTCNVVASEVMVANIPCITVINTTMNQLESKVSLIKLIA